MRNRETEIKFRLSSYQSQWLLVMTFWNAHVIPKDVTRFHAPTLSISTCSPNNAHRFQIATAAKIK